MSKYVLFSDFSIMGLAFLNIDAKNYTTTAIPVTQLDFQLIGAYLKLIFAGTSKL